MLKKGFWQHKRRSNKNNNTLFIWLIMAFHQVFIRQNRLIISNGECEISYAFDEVQHLIEALQKNAEQLEQKNKKLQTHIEPLQDQLQTTQKKWDPVGSDDHLQTALQLAIEGSWEVGLQSLILVFGEQSAFDAISRCWNLDDLGWASMKEGLHEDLLFGLLGMTACAPKDHVLLSIWNAGSFDQLLLTSLKNIAIPDIPTSIYPRVLHLLTQEIYLPPTTFMMGQEGSDAWGFEGPIHEVVLKRPIYAMIFPVTQMLFANAFDDSTPIQTQQPSFFVGATKPVEKVSWLDAIHFCNLLNRQQGWEECYEIQGKNVVWNREANGYRLPTEAEWECLARGNQPLPFAGNDDPQHTAWFLKNSEEQTHCVGQKQPNALGLYDMCGNVWEWCWDGYTSKYPSHTQIDPIGSTESKRVLRGGGFESNKESIRVTMRGRFEKDYTWKCLGLRLVRNG
jgi:formylglycine-generating enzyme required for sulfatase activity